MGVGADVEGRARAIVELERFFLTGRIDGEEGGFKERDDIEGGIVESVDEG